MGTPKGPRRFDQLRTRRFSSPPAGRREFAESGGFPNPRLASSPAITDHHVFELLESSESLPVNAADPKRASFAELLEQYHAGDPDAIAELYASYNEIIRHAVRRRLPHRLRQEFDSIDFTQDVWASFCAMNCATYQFPTQVAFEGYLTQIALNKVIEASRRRFANRDYGNTREENLVPVVGQEPTPSQWAIAGEQWSRIAATLPAPHVAIIERLREGFTRQEVADMGKVTLRTVVRIVQRVQRLCEGSA